MRRFVPVYVDWGFPWPFTFQKRFIFSQKVIFFILHFSSQFVIWLDHKPTLSLKILTSLENEGLSRKGYKMQCLKDPLFLTRAPTKDFKFLLEMLKCKLKGWRCKTLLWARRCTLIKTVAQALPAYSMAYAYL